MQPPRFARAVALCLLAGCAPSRLDLGIPDGAEDVSADAAPTEDTSADVTPARPLDVSPVDAAPDVVSSDAAPDAPLPPDASVDVPPSPDAPPPPPDAPPPPPDAPPPPPDAPTACAVVGTYVFRSPIGTTMYLRMRADGMWAYATSAAALDRSTLSGTYTASGDQISIRETGTSLEGCTSSQSGVYRMTFTPSCTIATLGLVSDACRLRGLLLGGRSFTRL